MGRILNPVSGLCNRKSELGFEYPNQAMGRSPKPLAKPESLLVAIAARNCRRLLDYTYPQLEGQITKQMERLEKDRGVAKTTMQRWTNGEGGTVSKLEDIAAAFGLSVYQLLLPNLDVANYQVLPGAATEEHRLTKALQRGEDVIRPRRASAEPAETEPRRRSGGRP